MALPIGMDGGKETETETEKDVDNNSTEIIDNSTTGTIICPNRINCSDPIDRTFLDFDFEYDEKCPKKNEIRNLYGDCIDSLAIIVF